MDSNTYDHVMAKWFRSIVSALKHSIRLSQGMSTVKCLSSLPTSIVLRPFRFPRYFDVGVGGA